MMDILTQIPYNEFDYLALVEALKSYKYPKDKITKLIKTGRIAQLKRGIYIQGLGHANGVYSKEIIANLLYGPSYISLEYALAYYDLIPERVEVVTSITMKKRKEYNTPLGRFIYFALKKRYYSVGVTYKRAADGRGYFIATPEKALLDKIYFENSILSLKEMNAFLFENLRMAESGLKKMDTGHLEEIISIYKKNSFYYLLTLLKKL